MEYESELYAERLRLKAQAERLAAGSIRWTDRLDDKARIKLSLLWEDVLERAELSGTVQEVNNEIARRSVRSTGVEIRPGDMKPPQRPKNTSQDVWLLKRMELSDPEEDELLLSLLEAEHELLQRVAARSTNMTGYPGPNARLIEKLTKAPEQFRTAVNTILEAHLVGFHLHSDSHLVPIHSQEIHDAVVEPTLHLLHSQPRFAGAEVAYQNALKELRNRDPADAITDAATALQEALVALGCAGNTIGELLKSARKLGLIKGKDTPLTETIGRAVQWVSDTRNEGEVHTGEPEINMSDAWMVVHVVGALVIRLSEAGDLAADGHT